MSFRSPASQAVKMMKVLQKTTTSDGTKAIKSVGTVRNYEQGLTRAAEWLKETNNGALHRMTPELAKSFLEARSELVGQKELDMERQSIQCMLRFGTRQLDEKDKLDVIKSDFEQVLGCRSYTPEQIKAIRDHQTESNALATDIAANAGLRAHELFTLRPIEERQPDNRPALAEKFLGHNGKAYTVQGKGGLIREIRIREDLAQRLEQKRLDSPRHITDRKVFYQSHYDLGGGKRWSNSFSKTSNRHLGFSNGAHGLRHTFAQNRMDYLQKIACLDRESALEIVSQEMGHFRPDITEVYLR